MPSVNEITGNNLVSKASNQEAYAEGWDRIFGKKPKEYKLPKSIILRNSARCLNCNEKIESKHRHDLVDCECGGLAVDGGHDYIKRSYVVDYAETSIESNDLLVARDYFEWGSFGKNGDEPKHYIKLKDMETSHIQVILETQPHIRNSVVEELFKLELQYREDTNYAPKD